MYLSNEYINLDQPRLLYKFKITFWEKNLDGFHIKGYTFRERMSPIDESSFFLYMSREHYISGS